MKIDRKENQIFSELSDEAWLAIQSRLFSRDLDAGQTLFLEGGPAESCYFIQHGALRILRTNPEGRVQVIARLGMNQPVNIISLLNQPRVNQATAEAITSTSVYVLTAADFDTLLTNTPEFSQTLLKAFANRISQMVDLAADLSLYPVRVRLARFILQLAESDVEPSGWTQDEIAAQIGTIRDVVGRLLREFEDQELIQRERSEITLLDRKGLNKAAHLPEI
ncbi:MAG: Crp/Fnr family transcriptional regulator [Chloroflexota bacterium]|nr:Crp/Fnr family transcriptional regulator [Chloroflexota bacterium]